MTSTALELLAPDTIARRVMFALELVDPITGRIVSEGMTVTVPGLAPPVLSPSGRFVWIDIDPPAKRAVEIEAKSKRRIFAPVKTHFDAPARAPGVKASDLVKRYELIPTGLYEPPAGTLAAAGMLIDNAANRKGLPAVEVKMCLFDAGNTPLVSAFVATTDEYGQFVAAMMPAPDPSTLMMMPPPDSAARLAGWLAFTTPGSPTRYTPLLPLRKGRLLRNREPFVWATLSQQSPDPPQAPP